MPDPTDNPPARETPRLDRPLSVERLSAAELVAAGRAVATIVAARHAARPVSGQSAFTLSVSWYEGAAGESWWIGARNATVAIDHSAVAAEADRLLQPILQAMRPRALHHMFRSVMDEATLEDLNMIGNAGVMPSPDAFAPRWVEDRTVLEVSPAADAGQDALQDAERVLAAIARRLRAE